MDEKDIKVYDTSSPRGALLLIVGNNQLLQVDPRLIIARARSLDLLEATVSVLKSVMEVRGVPRGVVIAAKDIALAWFGPIPDAWLDAGISVYHSPVAELDAGQEEFIREYQRLRCAFANRIRASPGGPGGGGTPYPDKNNIEPGDHRHDRPEPGAFDPQDPRPML